MKQKVAFAIIMGLITTGVISFILVCVNRGLTQGLALAWMKSWIIAYTVVIPVVSFLGPKVQLLVTNFFKEKAH